MSVDELPYVERLVVVDIIFLRRRGEQIKMTPHEWNSLPADSRITCNEFRLVRVAKVKGQRKEVVICQPARKP